MKLLVEGVEALVESERRGDRVGADKGRCRVTAALQTGRQRWIRRAEREHDVASNTVGRRVLPGENRRVRGTGERHRGLHLIEPHATTGERVQSGGRAARRPTPR